MHYTIYKINCHITDKVYIGKHKTVDLNDGYMGSGKLIKKAIQKYGLENFSKVILFVFDNEHDMNSKEKELVTKDFCSKEETYNLCPGGYGGWGYVVLNGLNTKGVSKGGKIAAVNTKIKREKDPNFNKSYCKTRAENFELGRKIRDELYPCGTMYGKHHKDETKTKIGEKNSLSQKGIKNSQYGTRWITNGIINKKINKEEPIPNGWVAGRKIKDYQD